uniref:Trafficking kinesin-binding protein 1 n=1 Tax=Angiostrongylus cantonensis TaxID=6313 RepID=A0A0K0CYJ8_ANGCA
MSKLFGKDYITLPLLRKEPSEDPEQKAGLISQNQRVDVVEEDRVKLCSENQVLGQYIENLMAFSSVFQSSNTGRKQNDTIFGFSYFACRNMHHNYRVV